jgi:hypothetical protein
MGRRLWPDDDEVIFSIHEEELLFRSDREPVLWPAAQLSETRPSRGFDAESALIDLLKEQATAQLMMSPRSGHCGAGRILPQSSPRP